LYIDLRVIPTRAIVSIIVFSKRIIIIRMFLRLGFLRSFFRFFLEGFILVFQASNSN
jgi:hypothetical protein